MSRVCRTAKEFAEAVKNNEEYITIEGDLKNGVLRIKARVVAAPLLLYLSTEG